MLGKVVEMLAYANLQFNNNVVVPLIGYFELAPFLMGVLSIYLSYHFLLKPIVGGESGSDKAKKSKGKDDKE